MRHTKLVVSAAMLLLVAAAAYHVTTRDDASGSRNRPGELSSAASAAVAPADSRVAPPLEAQRSGAKRRKAHNTALSTLVPVQGDAAQVIDALTPAAKSGDISAALSIFVKANDCRLRTESAKVRAPNAYPPAWAPPDCQSLTPEDYLRAGQWLETAADAGNVDAQFLYSANPESVLGPPVEWIRHPGKVATYKRKAMAFTSAHAANGSIDALLDLSTAYEYGVLTERDPIKALAYYRVVGLSDPSAVSQQKLDYLQQNLSPTDVLNAEKQARLIHASCCE